MPGVMWQPVGHAAPALAWNLLPVADIKDSVTPPQQYIASGNVVTLDGSDSRDLDGWIITYEWQVYKWNGSSWSYYGIQYGSPTSRRFTTPAKYKLDLNVEDNDNDWSSSADVCYVTAVRVTLSGGGYIGGIGAGGPISLSLEPSLSTGDVTLSKSRSNTGDVSVYYNWPPTDPVTLPATWSSGSFPSTLYVKGTAGSSSVGDVTLTMAYVKNGVTVHSDPETFTVLNLQITQPDGNPQYDHEFAFSSATPGTCSVQVSGTTGISSLDANPNDLKWTLTDKTPQYGATTTFSYSSLPITNTGFGQKTLTLRYLPLGVEATKTIELFYPKTATNNLYGWPNWAYYWQSNGQAVVDLAGFGFESNDDYYGRYYPDYDRLVVTQWAATDIPETTLTLYNHFYQAKINSGEDGYPSTQTPAGDDERAVPTYPYFDQGHGGNVYGPPYSVAITGGTNGVIDTVPQGNDGKENRPGEGWILHTGWDGKLSGSTQTPAGDDQWKMYEYMGALYQIKPNGCKPWTILITAGPNGWLDTVRESDDEIDLPSAYSVTYSVPSTTGIDSVALTCAHEREHQARYEQVRLPQPTVPPYAYSQTNDGDYVDDYWEESTSGYHLRSSEIDTYDLLDDTNWAPEDPELLASWKPDNEFCAYMAEMDRGPTNPSADWSQYGRNWDENHP